jgi:hypothetical protein
MDINLSRRLQAAPMLSFYSAIIAAIDATCFQGNSIVSIRSFRIDTQ